MAIILALVALAGSTWALMKAIRMPRALEKKLKTLEAQLDTTRRWEGGRGGESETSMDQNDGSDLWLLEKCFS